MNKPADIHSQPEVIGAEAYTSREYARAESARLWPKVWQHACREEEIPEVGDYVTYDIMDDTVVVVRSAPDTISAFFNVCAHRGKRLASGCGSVREFRCSYHAWTYDLTGKSVSRAEALKRLKNGGFVLISGDHRLPDDAYLGAFKGDLLVLASPDLVLPQGVNNVVKPLASLSPTGDNGRVLVDAVCTVRITRPDISAYGVDVGVTTDA